MDSRQKGLAKGLATGNRLTLLNFPDACIVNFNNSVAAICQIQVMGNEDQALGVLGNPF